MDLVHQDIQLFEMAMGTINRCRAGDVEGNWIKFTDYPTIKLYYRQEEGTSSLYTVYGEKVIQSKLFDVCPIVAEVDTFKNWIPLLYKSEIPYEVSHFRKTASLAVKLPWPIWNRGTELQVTCMPVPGQKAIIALMKSINGDQYYGRDVDRADYVD